ncbi:MAG TPA: ankyrin repeat domain-containing protein [Cytophagales bacterium]|nr:ankyrin repeat domain-containing protein [Cytophagales bacterium]HAP61681.1 ankyrin repeat domain-containing protein [Cytophagales bacterium]
MMKYTKTLTAILFLFLLTIGLPACTQNNTKQEGASIEAPDVDLNTAVVTGNLEVVKQHIAAGSDLNPTDPFTGSTPLITSASFNHPEIAKALIAAGADLNAQNNDGSTALHSAAWFGRVDMVQLLVEAQADATVRNNFGATARESVMGDFAEVKPVYEMMQQQLAPMGIVIDLEEVEKARPVVAGILE